MPYTKRLLILVALGLLSFAGLSVHDADAQGKKLQAKSSLTPKLFDGPDLAVTNFQGVLEGAEYILGGTIHNNGPGSYFSGNSVKGGSIRGSTTGRRIELYVVLNGGLGRDGSTKLLRSFSIPSMKSGADFKTPTMRIPTREVPGPATAQFMLKISGSDRETSNDWKAIFVSPVKF